MKSNKLLGLLIGVPLVLVIAGVIIVSIIFFTDSGSKRRSATATAEITNAVPVSWVQSRRTKYGYSVSYRFKTGDGRTIEANDPQNTLYESGTKTLRVCYDPKNPTDSDLRHPTRGTDCGKGLLF